MLQTKTHSIISIRKEFLIGDAIPHEVCEHVQELTGLKPRRIDYRNRTIDIEDGRGFSQAQVDSMMKDATGIKTLRIVDLLYPLYIGRLTRFSKRPVRPEAVLADTQLEAARNYFRENQIAEESDTARIIIAALIDLEDCYKEGTNRQISSDDFSFSFGKVPINGLIDEMEIKTKCPAHTLVPIWIKVGRQVIQRSRTEHPELF